MSSTQLTEDARARLDLARRLADDVGALALASYQSPDLVVDTKDDGSVVTAVDREGEWQIRRAVAEAFPDDAILGEEHGETPGSSGFTWVIDPIDGTKSFTLGIPHFAVLIGIEHDGEAIAGVAVFPALGEAVFALRGDGAWWRTKSGMERPARVSTTGTLPDAMIEVGSPQSFIRAGVWDARARLEHEARRIRGWSDAYAFALVATGRVDAAIQMGLSWWDIAPFVVIMSEAGGTLTEWTGRPTRGSRVLATGPGLSAELEQTLGA